MNWALKEVCWRRAFAKMAVVSIFLCCLGEAADGVIEGKELTVFIEKCAEQERLLKLKLSEASLWTDATRKEERLGYLQLAGTLRPKSLAPILVAHIDYDPYPGRVDTAIRPPWLRYPAYGVLLRIGTPSVPHLLNEMKKTAPKDGNNNKHRLLAACLYEIYDLGGHGGAVAKKRLELELTKTEGEQESASLRAALGYSLFE